MMNDATRRRVPWCAGAALLAVYVLTMAPTVTFWDAGEFIAAARTFGIPHPPGTPLFAAAGRIWTSALGGVLGVARASNLLSAVCTALAGAITASIIARSARAARGAQWGAIVAALCAGMGTSVWANATETEVYAVSLMHVTIMVACALRACDAPEGDTRWLSLLAYVIALAPAVHLSALVGAPAAMLLASRSSDGRWRPDRFLLLGGVLLSAAAVGRMSWSLGTCGALVGASSVIVRPASGASRTRAISRVALAGVLVIIATSALLLLLYRARHDPGINQGNPRTLSALADVVARRQYDVSPLWPRQAPVWLQVVSIAQYADWQFAFGWGDGIFTTPVRVLVTVLFLVLGVFGWKAMRTDAPRLADAFAVLALCGSVGVCAYLNLKAGASIGYGFVAGDAHEARERDYFFVLAFWAWGIFAGYGATSFARARAWPAAVGMAVVFVPLFGNWQANDRSAGAEATAARTVAIGLLSSAPRHAMLFVAGDNDTYPLWYAQQVEHLRPDVTTVTYPLLPAEWYVSEIARRTGLRWPAHEYVPGAKWSHEERAALIARAARQAGRPVAASPALSAHDRALLGSNWVLHGLVYIAGGVSGASDALPTIDSADVPGVPEFIRAASAAGHLPDDVSAMMLDLFRCRELARPAIRGSPARDSLETRCNLR